MTARRRFGPDARPVEVRINIPAEAHEDFKAIARVKGLPISTLIRSIALEYRARIYAKVSKTDD